MPSSPATRLSNNYTSHLKRINDNKFALASSSEDLLQLYIFIFDLYNQDTNLFIRYYLIQLKLYNLQMLYRILCLNNQL